MDDVCERGLMIHVKPRSQTSPTGTPDVIKAGDSDRWALRVENLDRAVSVDSTIVRARQHAAAAGESADHATHLAGLHVAGIFLWSAS
ncbi:hypothetical protein ACFZC6_16105 [Streptomyces ossamyceticus]|jgi:hypothetical protein|uniref:Uncharacterized protein n=1 Tax=Streptomyces ossamyceticus TaxID=249581 RepID=A0ABV2UNA5_9ACTN